MAAREESAMRTMLACGVGACLVLGAAATGRCEGGSGTVAFAAAGAGIGSGGVAGVVSLDVHRGRLVYIARCSRVEEFQIFGPSPTETDTDYGVLVGKSSSGHRIASAAVGLALVKSIRRGDLIERGWFGDRYQKLERVTVGLPVDLKATVNAGPVGIGADIFGNINANGIFWGAALTVQLGKMR
jgi:hypothetical protein